MTKTTGTPHIHFEFAPAPAPLSGHKSWTWTYSPTSDEWTAVWEKIKVTVQVTVAALDKET